MKRTAFVRVGLALLGFAAASAFAAAAAPLAGHVVVVGIDGLSSTGINRTKTPNIDALVGRGVHTWHVRAVMPTSSSPNWASMIMGAGPEQHGVTSNDWEPERHEITPVVKGPGKIFPTIFGTLRQQRPASLIAIFHDWKGYARLTERDMVDVIEHQDSDKKSDRGARQTMAAATRFFAVRKPTFLFVHLDHVDHVGHRNGWYTEEYFAAVGVADQLVGDMVRVIKSAGAEDDTILLVVADHGGFERKHGGNTMQELEIPWVMAGPGIKRRFEITDPVNVFDTAPTLARILGITPPSAWIARPVSSAFE